MQNLEAMPMIELTDAETATVQGGMSIAPGGCYPQPQPQPQPSFSFSVSFSGWSWNHPVMPVGSAPATGRENDVNLVAHNPINIVTD
jgi:hypothetical protein